MIKTWLNDYSQGLVNIIQSIAFIAAGAWAFHTFYYSESVHISTNLELQAIGSKTINSVEYQAIELRASVTNPSTREVSILPNIMLARGVKLGAKEVTPPTPTKILEGLTRPGDDLYSIKTLHLSKQFDVVMLSELFSDWKIQPKESMKRRYVFYVPKGKYDSINIQATLRTIYSSDIAARLNYDNPDKPYLEFSFDKKSWIGISSLSTEKRKKIGLMAFTARDTLNLWNDSPELIN